MVEIAEHIARWVRDISLDPPATRQKAMEAASKKLLAEADHMASLDFILIANGETSEETSLRIGAALSIQDDTWAVRPGDLEESLTAAIVAALAFEDKPEVAVIWAISQKSAAFLGLSPIAPGLNDLAVRGMVNASESMRAHAEIGASRTASKNTFSKMAALPAGQGATTDHISDLAESTSTTTVATSNALVRAMGQVNQRLKALDEEANLLWWVINGYSRISNCPFPKMPLQGSGAIAGVEYAGLLQFGCPLPSTRGLLHHVLGARSESSTSLVKAVPALCKAIGTDWFPGSSGHALLPVTSCVREFLELDGARTWVDSVRRWGIDPSKNFNQLEIAEQLTNELVLLSLVEHV